MPNMKTAASALVVLTIASAALLRAQSDGRERGQGDRTGPPPGVFHTEVPSSALNIVAGAPTASSVKLSVLSSGGGTLDLSYAPIGQERAASTAKVVVVANQPQEVAVSDLRPNTTYSYRLSASGGQPSVAGTFATARMPGTAFVFDVQADSHLDGNSDLRVYENTLNNIVADRPDFLIDLGDTFMVDKYREYQDAVKNYQAQRYWFSIPGGRMPVFLCLGNHDGETGWAMRGGSTTAWARTQRQRIFPVIRPGGFYTGAPAEGLYYAWAWGDALFVVLDPFVATTNKPRTEEDSWNWTLGEAQYRWFENTLRESNARYKFVFIHQLVGGLGKDARGGAEAADRGEWGDTKGFAAMRPGWSAPIHTLMVRYGVSALFHGHDHLYARQERDGILYQEVPQPSSARENGTISAEEYGYRTGTLLGSPGHLRITVGAAEAKVEYVKSRLLGANREVVDSVSVAPRGGRGNR